MTDILIPLEADGEELDQIARLAGYARPWNLFEATGSVWREERHSDTLAFLLSPSQHHGLGDMFAIQLFQSAGISPPVGRFPHLVVEREWGRQWQGRVPRIDLLLLDDMQRLAVIIENKTGSSERPGQLQTYWEMVHHYFPDWAVAGIYLTPYGNAPAELSDRDHYRPISYTTVCKLLEQIADAKPNRLEPDVLVLLNHYVQTLRRHIMEIPAELIERCQAFYRKHQQALDLVFQYRPDQRLETRQLIATLIEETPGLQLVWSRPDGGKICFVVDEWNRRPKLTQSNWPHSNAMLLFEVDNYPNIPSLTLRLYIAPGPEAIRKELSTLVDAHPQIFAARRNAYDDWIIVYERTLLDPIGFNQLSGSERVVSIREGWASFCQQALPVIRSLVDEQKWLWEPTNHEGTTDSPPSDIPASGDMLPSRPSAEQYKEALRAIRASLSVGQLAMLRSQYHASEHTLTATELAAAAGYQGFRGANLQYGRLGTLLREALGYWDDGGQASYVLSSFYEPNTLGNSDWLFVMHSEVAQALTELGWFSPAPATDNQSPSQRIY